MLLSNYIKVLVVMQVGAWCKYMHAGNIVEDNANGNSCNINQTGTFVRIKN